MQRIENYNLAGVPNGTPATPAPVPAARSVEPAPRKVKLARKKTVRSTTGRPTVPAPGGWERRTGGALCIRGAQQMNPVAEILRADGVHGLSRRLAAGDPILVGYLRRNPQRAYELRAVIDQLIDRC